MGRGQRWVIKMGQSDDYQREQTVHYQREIDVLDAIGKAILTATLENISLDRVKGAFQNILQLIEKKENDIQTIANEDGSSIYSLIRDYYTAKDTNNVEEYTDLSYIIVDRTARIIRAYDELHHILNVQELLVLRVIRLVEEIRKGKYNSIMQEQESKPGDLPEPE